MDLESDPLAAIQAITAEEEAQPDGGSNEKEEKWTRVCKLLRTTFYNSHKAAFKKLGIDEEQALGDDDEDNDEAGVDEAFFAAMQKSKYPEVVFAIKGIQAFLQDQSFVRPLCEFINDNFNTVR